MIALTGPATLAEAPRLRDELREGMARGHNFLVDLEAAGPWDAIGLQLLIATVASATRDCSTVRFVKVPDVCLAAAERAGLRNWIDLYRAETVGGEITTKLHLLIFNLPFLQRASVRRERVGDLGRQRSLPGDVFRRSPRVAPNP
ncbi:MAG: hypothetical protein NVSMB14_04500 [Isosphaeraceae bacterium]